MKMRSRSGSSPVVSRSNCRRCSSSKREVAEVGASGRDQVLLLGRQREDGLFAELAQVGDAAAEAVRCGFEHGGGEGAAVVGGDEVAERSGAFEFAVVQMTQIFDSVEEEPGAELILFADQLAGFGEASPDGRARRRARPTRRRCRALDPSPTATRLCFGPASALIVACARDSRAVGGPRLAGSNGVPLAVAPWDRQQDWRRYRGARFEAVTDPIGGATKSRASPRSRLGYAGRCCERIRHRLVARCSVLRASWPAGRPQVARVVLRTTWVGREGLPHERLLEAEGG